MRRIICLFLIFFFCIASTDANTPWMSKPPLGSQINWSHPLSKGLVGCWLMNERGGKIINDLALRVPLTLFNNATTIFGARKYPGLLTLNDGDGVRGYIHPSLRVSPPVTIVWFGRFDATPEANANIFGISYDDASSSPYCFYNINNNATNNYWRISSNGSGTIKHTTSTTAIQANVNYLVVGVFRSLSNREIYVNGISIRFDTTSWASPASTTTSPVLFGAEVGATTRNSSCIHYMGLIFNRALSPSEILQLYREPYCFIKGQKSWWKVVASKFKTFVNIF